MRHGIAQIGHVITGDMYLRRYCNCGLGNQLQALILAAGVLCTNIVLRSQTYRLHPAQAAAEEQEVTYGFELICRPEDETHMHALMLHGMSRTSLTLAGLRSEDIEGPPR